MYIHKMVIAIYRADSSQCHCNDGYGGEDCSQEDVNECKYRPCSIHADCTNTLGSFRCTCRDGFQGDGFECVPSVEVNEVLDETKEAILDTVKEMIASSNGTFEDPNIGMQIFPQAMSPSLAAFRQDIRKVINYHFVRN